MEFHRNSTPMVDGQSTVVSGRSLSEAYKKVRLEFGPEAVISGSRTRSRRKSSGWGTEQIIEVMVEGPGSSGTLPSSVGSEVEVLTSEIRDEVERLERMVDDICRTPVDQSEAENQPGPNPLAEYLIQNGASAGTVDRLVTRFGSETGRPSNDRPGILAWLSGHLATSEKALPDWSGNHIFLGEHPADRLDLVLHLAGLLTEAGRRVLVVSVLPDPHRDEPRLKESAAVAGFDAAVCRAEDDVQDMEPHLSGYDHVLLDLPGLLDSRLAEDRPLHAWLAANERFHRHLMLPMDRDFLDLGDLRAAARSWNCDWLALTRVGGTRRPAKLLDLFDNIPLPVSFLAEGGAKEGSITCATGEMLLDRVLAANSGPELSQG